jgi:hypothetical protein
VPNNSAMPADLLHELTLAILDDSADKGLQTIKVIRSYLDTWEAFLQDRQELLNHLIAAHKAGPFYTETDPASLNRRHWQAHGSDLATFLCAHPVRV